MRLARALLMMTNAAAVVRRACRRHPGRYARAAQARGTRSPAPALAIVLLCALALPQFAAAQEQLPATTQPASADAGDAEIRALITRLTDRESGLAAVESLRAMKDARVLAVFQHISDKALYEIDGQIVFVPGFRDDPEKGAVGDLYDIFVELDENNQPLGAPMMALPKAEILKAEFSVPRPVRVRVLDALRLLGLEVDDPRVRRNFARGIGNRRQAEALPALRRVAENDPDAKVRREAAESVNLILADLNTPDVTPEQRSAAISALGELNSLRALDMLRQQSVLETTSSDDKPVYAAAIAQIERHLSITNWIKNLFFGLSAGSIYVLLALGLAITFGLMGVINMAHGEMLMIGAVTTWACCEFIGKALPAAWFDYYYVIAFPAAFLAAAAVGLVVELTIVRFLYKRPLDSLLATIGVSYVLIQLVRNWKGDNLGMRAPSWAGRNLEVFQDVLLPYNRLFLIALTIFCLLSVVIIFRYTRIGLMIRATVQNREMAQALGVNTRLVDMFCFAFGAGLAGLAGYGIVLTSNPTPEIGQTFIVKSFLTVVVGGVGKLIGVVVSGLGIGFAEKLLEPLTIISSPIRIFDATWAQVAALLLVILFMQRRPAGLFPDKGRMADQADRISTPLTARLSRRGEVLLGLGLAVIGLGIVPLLYGSGIMSLEYINKLGYILSFAICAIGLDLIWGYIGVLSLMQFLFFAIGGYAMGLYLINHGPMDGPEKNIPTALYVVMSAVSGATPPWFLGFFKSFPGAVFLGLLLPGLLALLIGLGTFRSRVRGVYFSILTQAITVAFWLIFQKNELKLGGTNGLTNFTHILGFPIQANADAGPFEQTRFWLYIASMITLLVVLVVAKLLVNSGFGRVLVAIRDDETRLRFVGYQTWAYKATAFTFAALFAAIGGMLYVPQKGIITPHQIAAVASILVVAWVAVGGRGTLWGAVIGAIFVSLLYEYMTSVAPEYWYFVLGGLFILVPLLLPGGIMSIPQMVTGLLAGRPRREQGFEVPAAPGVKVAEGRPS